MTMTDDEKRDIARRFKDLQDAINQGVLDVDAKYQALCRVYRGDSLAILGAFHQASDKRAWVGQLAASLADEVDSSFFR